MKSYERGMTSTLLTGEVINEGCTALIFLHHTLFHIYCVNYGCGIPVRRKETEMTLRNSVIHFSKTPNINEQFQFVKINYSPKRNEEPFDGIIEYNGKTFYFKYHADFFEGNRYLVYQN